MELLEKPIHLKKTLLRFFDIFESQAQLKEIEYKFDFQLSEELIIEIDNSKLEVIVNNLISNALKFAPVKGKVQVAIIDSQSFFTIKVSDNGGGIHSDDLPHIFNRFYQSKQLDAPREGGTGIGLALSKEFCKLMGGKMWVESKLGMGSTFFVQLPLKIVSLATELTDALVRDEAEWLQPVAPKSLSVPTEKEQSILIVEDSINLQNYFQHILQPYFSIRLANNGQEALNLLKKDANNLPSIILSDIMMPIMDGHQLLTQLKADPRYGQIPVIILTASGDIQDKLKALRIGVDDYLLKPFYEEELFARIDNLLKNAELRKEGTEEEDQPVKVAINKEDEEWFIILENHLRKELANNQYSISQLAHDLAISERQLRRRIKQMTGISPAAYFREIRLRHARTLLEQKEYKTVAQYGIAVGYKDIKSFSRNFSQRFGRSPADYLNN